MKVKATVAQLISLSTTLGQLGGKQHAKLTWAALIDLRRLRDVVEETFKQRDALYTPEYKAFEKAREEFRSKFCTEHELPVDTKNFGKLAYKFEEGVLELTRSEAHRQACDDFSAGSRDFASLLETEAELELQAIDVAWLPKRINLLTFSNLRPVLKDADGHLLESLGGIGDPSPSYRRLIEAELALEAMP